MNLPRLTVPFFKRDSSYILSCTLTAIVNILKPTYLGKLYFKQKAVGSPAFTRFYARSYYVFTSARSQRAL